jgi:hypothetical protein
MLNLTRATFFMGRYAVRAVEASCLAHVGTKRVTKNEKKEMRETRVGIAHVLGFIFLEYFEMDI